MRHVAEASGRSVSEEIERRLDRSLSSEDILSEVLGGRDFRNMAIELAASFSRAAQQEARLNDNPGWAAKEWLRDKSCYRAGMFAVVGELLKALPLPAATEDLIEEVAMLKEFFNSELNAALIQRGRLKFDFGDGAGPVGSGFVPPKKDDAS